MSSQSVNATTYSGYRIVPTASVGPPAVYTLFMLPTPARDASDITRAIRERITYNEFKASTPVSPGNTEDPWIPYGNAIRLSYLYGKLKCGSCSGNAMYGNGPYPNNVGYRADIPSTGPS